MDLSLIIPCHNEAGNIHPFAKRVLECMGEADAPQTLELIFVDDGSSDGTFAKVLQLIEGGLSPRISVEGIELSRNFGKEAAMLAGLEHAQGSMVGFIDADLQQDPAISFQMSMPEYFRFSKGLFAWVGFNTHTIPYTPAERHAGDTSWSFRKLMGYALGGIVSFTTWPLRLILYLGLLTSLISVIYLIVVLFEYLIVGINVPGYPTLVCLILLFFGIVMLALGIFGEYLGRIYIEGKRRPVYIARRTVNQPSDDLRPEERS